METVWNLKKNDPQLVAELSDELDIPLAVASVYCSKGLTTAEAIKDFQNLSPKKLHSPATLPDIKPVLERLIQAVEGKEKIFVWGDYDVDGITATAVVVTALKAFGANFIYKVPHRIDDGYDLKPAAVDEVIQSGATLLMSVDCGIKAFEAAEYAKKQGLDLIITDHHEPREDHMIPDCIGVVNPNREDSEYPFNGLAGVGIAFKVMMALGKKLDYDLKSLFKSLIEYVALGTVADVAPMIDENRILVSLGCNVLSKSKKPGIQELLKIAGVKEVTPLSIGFQLGPRINAIGRLADSMTALDLMLEETPSKAKFLALQLDTANKRRQTKQEATVKEAIEAVESMKAEDKEYVIVIGARNWHPGLIGLVAGKLVETYNKPALVCAINDKGKAKGSCRSTRRFNMLNALRSEGVIQWFSKKNDGSPIFGGHAYAAGFEVPETDLINLRKAVNEYAKEFAEDVDANRRVLDIDAKIQPRDISDKTYESLMNMSPFGSFNEMPIFQCKSLVIKEIKTLSEGKHLKMLLTHRLLGYRNVEAVAWKQGLWANELKPGDLIDMVFQMETSDFMGRKILQANVLDFKKI